MKIFELLHALQSMDGRNEIFLSIDEEGNEIKPIDTIGTVSLEKKNGKGDFGAIVLFPTSEVRN